MKRKEMIGVQRKKRQKERMKKFHAITVAEREYTRLQNRRYYFHNKKEK